MPADAPADTPAIATSRVLSRLPALARFEDAADPAAYSALPDDWALALADVVNSTAAIAAGRYKAVNMAGAAVIAAVMNAIGIKTLPFVFGGDGAAVAVPPEGIGAARAALAAVRAWVGAEMDLDLRTALVPVAAIRAAGHDLRVARYAASTQVGYAMFAGGGARWAEAEMKAGRFAVAPGDGPPDLTGLSCRWSPVSAQNGVILSLIVLPGAAGQNADFRALVAEVLALAGGGARGGNPVPDGGPPLRLSLAGVAAEADLVRGMARRLARRLVIVALAGLMVVLYRTNRTLGGFDAREYAADIARNADFRKFDDGLKMTVDVTPAQADRIEAHLAAAEAAGRCRHGLHRQDTALMTCIVPTPMTRDHMHFVDGGAGGYAEAARKLRARDA